jgi:D-alanyl-D-alanine carboxypeptidase
MLHWFTLLVAPAMFTAACAPPAKGAQEPHPFRRIVDSAVALGVPGLQVCVRRDQERWCFAAGYAGVERGAPMTLGHRIRLASITKAMTYATTMRLVESGRIRLSDRAVDLLPPRTLEGIPYAEEITVGHLLEHTSGLHNYNGEQGADFFGALFADERRGTRVWGPAELIAFARKPSNQPTGRPGERRSYSSTGYSVLELILERIGQKSLGDLFREHIFVPLGMKSAGIEGRDFDTEASADSYGRPGAGGVVGNLPFRGREPVRADGLVNLSGGLRYFNAWAGAGGAVVSSAEDLARFVDAILAGERVAIADQSAEFARARSRPGATFSWNGGSWGIQASAVVEPARDISIVVLTNGTNVGVGSYDLALRLLRETRETPALPR